MDWWVEQGFRFLSSRRRNDSCVNVYSRESSWDSSNFQDFSCHDQKERSTMPLTGIKSCTMKNLWIATKALDTNRDCLSAWRFFLFIHLRFRQEYCDRGTFPFLLLERGGSEKCCITTNDGEHDASYGNKSLNSTRPWIRLTWKFKCWAL